MSTEIEAIARDIVDAAYKVHKEFGPGLLESAYQRCHAYGLRKRGRIVLTELKLQAWLSDKLECKIDQERDSKGRKRTLRVSFMDIINKES